MNKINIDIIDFSDNKVLINAIEKPYSNEKVNLKTVNYVCNNMNHKSVLEHFTISFNISGLSRLCLQELVRHRIASYTVESTRYILKKFIQEYTGLNIQTFCVIPDELKKDITYINYLKNVLDIIKNKSDDLKNDVLKYFVPECFRTNVVFTINLRSLQNFLNLRLSKNAHFEIRYIANKIIEEINKKIPVEIYDIIIQGLEE